jgi:predicted glycosyltransferase
MRIWVDLANSPQVLFFRPILAELKRQGHEIMITSRDFAQTVALADQHGLTHTSIGHHGGSRWLNIFRRTMGRAVALAQWAGRQKPIDLVVSHNSYSQAVAARLIRRPFVTLMDYEHQPFNHICFRLARRVIVPETFPDISLRRFGATKKAVKYPGLKEQLYLMDFTPAPGYLSKLGIPEDQVVIAMRPPAPWAAYHRQFTNTLFDHVLTTLAQEEQLYIIFLPRVALQGEAVRKLGYRNIYVPEAALDGPNLLYHADLAISGGGTMNREAAVLGTRAYTVFNGKLGAVDQYLIDRGRLCQIACEAEVGKIKAEKHGHAKKTMLDSDLVGLITQLILDGASARAS